VGAPGVAKRISQAAAAPRPINVRKGNQRKEEELGKATIGWCETRDGHDGQFDHARQPTCLNFVSDAEVTAQLMAEARELDRKVEHRYPNGATNPAAAYVAEYRPF
jgi:hypothetical protein